MAVSAGTAYVSIKGDYGPLNAGLRKSQSSFGRGLSQIEGRAKRTFGGIGRLAAGVGGALGGLAIGAAAKDAVATTQKLAASTRILAQVTGLSTKEASRWASVASARDVEGRTLNQGFLTLSKNMAKATSGGEDQAAMFKQLGVSQKTLEGGKTGDAVLQIADAFQKLPAGAQKADLAVKLFGRQAQTLLPLLNSGSEGLRDQLKLADKYGVTMDHNAIKKAGEAAAAQRELSMAMDGVKIAFAQNVLPVLAAGAGAIANFIAQMRAGEGAGGRFAAVMKGVGDAIGPPLKAAIGAVANFVDEIVKGEGTGGRFRVVAEAIGEAVAKIASGFADLPGPIKIAAAAIAGIGLAMAVGLGPVGLAVAGVAAGVFLLVKHWDTVKNAVTSAVNAIGQALGISGEDVHQFGQAISNIVGIVLAVGKKAVAVLGVVLEPLATVWGSTIKRAFAGVLQIVRGALQVIGGVIKVWTGIFTGDFGKAWEGVKQIFRGGITGLLGVFRTLTAPMREVANRVGNAIVGVFRGVWRTVRGVFDAGIKAALGAVRGAIGAAVDVGGSIGRAVVRGIKRALDAVAGLFRGIFSGIKGIAGSIGRSIANWLNANTPFGDKISVGPLDFRIPKLAQGGIAKGLAIVGEEGKELAESRGKLAVVGKRGAEVRDLPVDTRIYSHRESVRIAERLGISGFADGGVVGRGPFAGRRRKKDEDEDEDPTARKRGQPDRESRGARGEALASAAKSTARPPGGILARANRLDAAGLPYRRGGGHGSIAEALKSGFDCSGAVSYVLGIPPRVSGQFDSWGSPGEGVVSTFSNAAHMVMAIKGRLFGTGDGTGPHWLSGGPAARFSAPFVTRHTGQSVGEAGDGATKKKKGPARFRHLTLGQYVTVAKAVGFPDPALAAAVFYAESMGNVRAENKTSREWSLGAAQINVLAHRHLNTERNRKRLQEDVFFNMREAKKISHGGREFTDWTKFTNGDYKDYLGGRTQALPRGKATAGTGGRYADLLELKMLEAEGSPTLKDDIKWINRGLKYWRGVYRRNKSVGNNSRAAEALRTVRELRDKKKEIRKGDEPAEAYKLGGLEQIGTGPNAFNLAGMQRVLDTIELEKARAALTEPADTDDTHEGLVASLGDDLGAASKLVSVWEGLNTLVSGIWRPVAGADSGKFTPTRDQQRQLDATKSQPERIALLNRFISERGKVWITGTTAQKIEAATELASAREAKKTLEDEIAPKTEEDATAGDADSGAVENEMQRVRADLLAQLLEQSQVSLAVLRAQFPIFERFANLPRAHQGAVIKGPVGSEVPVLTKPGEVIGYAGEPRDQSVTVVVEDGAVDPDKIRVVVGDEIASQVRKARSGPAIGRKLAIPR